MNRKYSPEMRERALRMLPEATPEHATMMSPIRHVAGLLGMSPETLRLWQRRYEVDAGVRPGITTEAAAEIECLDREAVTRPFSSRARVSRTTRTKNRGRAITLNAALRKVTPNGWTSIRRVGSKPICLISTTEIADRLADGIDPNGTD